MTEQQNQVEESFSKDPLKWMAEQADALKLDYLLLHCMDGITWGRREGKGFVLGHQVFPHDLDTPTIQADTILQARIFGRPGEIFIWRTRLTFAQRRILDPEQPANEWCEDCYWLWGTGQISDKGFTLMNEGQQGFRHAPPKPGIKSNQRLGLRVRHYLEEDKEDGWLRIRTSRLVDLEIVEGGQP
jgi:CRISPR-associated protein (TIGR03984 family)